MSHFKAGQKVVVKSGQRTSDFEDGDVFTVSDEPAYDNTRINILNKSGDRVGYDVGWYASRFELYEEPKPSLDLTQPLETVWNTPFKLITAFGRGEFSIIGYVGDRDYVSEYNIYGDSKDGHPYFKLRNVKPKPLEREVYVNVYKGSGLSHTGKYTSREDADRYASASRVSCIKVKLVEGQFDD